MNVLGVRRSIEGLLGFVGAAALGLWLPVASFGLAFAQGENPSAPVFGIDIPAKTVPLIPIGLWVLVMIGSFWIGIRRWRTSAFALGSIAGALTAISVLGMFFVVSWLAA
jgi:hypothetical protein